MIRYLTLGEVLELHRRIIIQTGGTSGVRNLAGLESALAQPRVTFAGRDLYPSLAAKAAALCFFVIQNHPFIDGNKRCGHAAMETFLALNGKEAESSVDEIEQVILQAASGKLSLEKLASWVLKHMRDVKF